MIVSDCSSDLSSDLTGFTLLESTVICFWRIVFSAQMVPTSLNGRSVNTVALLWLRLCGRPFFYRFSMLFLRPVTLFLAAVETFSSLPQMSFFFVRPSSCCWRNEYSQIFSAENVLIELLTRFLSVIYAAFSSAHLFHIHGYVITEIINSETIETFKNLLVGYGSCSYPSFLLFQSKYR